MSGRFGRRAGTRRSKIVARQRHGRKISGRTLQRLSGLSFKKDAGGCRGHLMVKMLKQDDKSVTWRCLCGREVVLDKALPDSKEEKR